MAKLTAKQPVSKDVDHDDRPLRILAAAVIGHPVSITYVMKDKARSYSDGDRIYLPAHEDLSTRRIEVMIQAALISGGAFSNKIMQRILGRAELSERFLVLEVERCCMAIESRLPSQLITMLAPYRSGFTPQDAEASLEIAQSRKSLPKPPEWYGGFRPWRVLRRNAQGGSKPMTEQKLAELEAQLAMITEENDEEEDDENIQKASFWKWFTSPLGKESFLSKMLQDLLDMGSSPGQEESDEGSAGSQMVSGRAAQRFRDIAMAIRSEMDITLPSAFAHAEAGAHSYHEWDCHKKQYKPDWVSVEETDPHALESNFEPGTLSGSNLPFQRALAGLYLGFQRHRGQPQGDDLVLDQMVRLAIDIRTGHSGDERIYSASLKTRRDLSVSILLDASSSTLEYSADGKRVFDLQAQTGWSLCRAFATLGDRVAMHGFNSWGRGLVRFQTVKTFDEPSGAALESRLRHMAIAGYTRCGAAIRHATAQMQEQAGTPYKLLILISDGYPYDDQYEGEYAGEDTSKAIEEARDQGVACVCLSVGSDADKKRLEKVYGASNYLAIHRSEQLVPKLHQLVESAIATAMKKVA